MPSPTLKVATVKTEGQGVGAAVPKIYLRRIGRDGRTGHEMGMMIVGTKLFSTREVGHGHGRGVIGGHDHTHAHVSLLVGTYRMKHAFKDAGKKVKCLRPVNPAISSILVHRAYHDNPNNLEGCIAPCERDADWAGATKAKSEIAMEKLFEELGGFHEGREVDLVVQTNVSYASGDMEHWARLQGPRHSR